MAINKKLIHFKKYETFNGSQGINGATEPTNGMYGNIPEHSIVFILDAKKIWTHGQLYDCDLSALEELGLIKELIEEIQNTLTADKFKEYDKEYLTFTALEDSSIGYEMPMWASDDELPVLDLLYSYDGITWTNFDGTTLSITEGNFVLFKGENTEFHRNIGTFIINGKVDVSGNIMSIVYADNFIGKIDFPNEEFNLSNLFGYLCLGLYSAHNLILPALNLTYLCYYDMFAECVSLTSTPELPATTLLEECYCGMFSGCTSLTIAPLLPSLELAPYCYSGMFYNCNSLVSTPELPATMLATSCYSGMFYKCSSLVNAPILPAIVLAFECYLEMFYECISLISTPELPATILADRCYNMMFYGCTSLTNVCELPAKKLKRSCYQGMFGMCTSLTEIPELHAKTLVYNCYTGMFSGCDNVTYATLLCDMPETSDQYDACTGMFSAPSGTIVLSSTANSYPTIVPQGWKVVNYYVNNEYISKLNNRINSSNENIESNTDEIEILKNRIISTTYSKLKDAVTNSTLTTGQYYRITDYVTTCNGTSAKVEDASTIDPENPVDGQSRSAGHQFDIIVRALSPNQLDENAVAVCNASETYYDSTFNGTVIKYSIENKYWSTEDGKGTIYYMKDHNDNECSYDFTNIEYYYAEDTTWYLTFTIKVDSRIRLNSIINGANILPFVLLIFKFSNSRAYIACTNIIGLLNTVIIKGAAISNNTISGTIDNLIVQLAHDENLALHTNDFIGFFSNVIITATSHLICGNKFTGYYSNVSITGYQVIYNEGNAELKDSNIQALSVIKYNTIFGEVYRLNCTAEDQISNNTFLYSSDVTINMYYILNNIFNYSSNINISSPEDTMTEKSYLNGNNFNNGSNINLTSVQYISRNIYNNVWDVNINTKYINYVLLFSVKLVSMDCPTKYFAYSIFTSCNNLTFINCGCNYNNISGSSKYLTFEGTSAGLPDYITIGKSVMYCTFTGMMLTLHVEDGSRYLHFTLTNEDVPLNTYVYNVRGSSKTSYLEIPLYGDNNLKQIYRDASDRIFYTWEDNGIKKGYYINNNTDTEWKEYSEEFKTINGNSIIGEGDITLVADSIETDSGLTVEEALANKAETYTITDFTAFDIYEIYRGSYTLTIDPNPLEYAIRNNKIILIQCDEDMHASPVLDAYVEDIIYLTIIHDGRIYSVNIEFDLTTLTSSSIECIYNNYDLLVTNITVDNKLNIKDALTITKDENDNALMQISENLYFDNYVGWNSGDGVQHYINAFGDAYLTDLRTNKLEIDNALTITKDNSDYAHLNISEGLTIDNLVEWTDGSDTTASINYDGSASFTNLSVAGKNVTSFLTHYNSDINVVRSLTNIPTDKAVVFAYINSSQELTFDDANLVSGRGVHVFIYNYSTKAITVILPSVDGSTYICDSTTEFEVSSESIAEVNMIYLSSGDSGSLKFIRSITV